MNVKSFCHFLNDPVARVTTQVVLDKCHSAGEGRNLSHELQKGSVFRRRD